MSALVSARFSGQVVLVAGGTGGLGSAVSVAFLEEGATVAVPYRSQPEFEALRSAAGPSLLAWRGMPSMLPTTAPFISLWPASSPSTGAWTP